MKKRWTEPPGKKVGSQKVKRGNKASDSQILGFKKSKHFIRRQGKRKICDCLLARILWKVKPTPIATAVIVTQLELQKMARNGFIEPSYLKAKKDLVLVVDGTELITCFPTSVNSYVTSSSIRATQFFYSNL